MESSSRATTMRGGWIRLRASLISSPKLMAMSRYLMADAEFRLWFFPGGGAEGASRHASHCVTIGLVTRVWCSVREHGEPDGDHLRLAHMVVTDLDEIAGAPGVGAAMENVGWAIVDDGPPPSIVLPEFLKINTLARSGAERAKAYRERKKAEQTPTRKRNATVTRTRRTKRNETCAEQSRTEQTASPAHAHGDGGGMIAQMIAFGIGKNNVAKLAARWHDVGLTEDRLRQCLDGTKGGPGLAVRRIVDAIESQCRDLARDAATQQDRQSEIAENVQARAAVESQALTGDARAKALAKIKEKMQVEEADESTNTE